jgi:hypothetical protein
MRLLTKYYQKKIFSSSILKKLRFKEVLDLFDPIDRIDPKRTNAMLELFCD